MRHFKDSTTQKKEKERERERSRKERCNRQRLRTSRQTTAGRCTSMLPVRYFCPGTRPHLQAIQLSDWSQFIFEKVGENMEVQHLPIICQHLEAYFSKNHRMVKTGRDPWNLSSPNEKQGYFLPWMFSITFLLYDIPSNLGKEGQLRNFNRVSLLSLLKNCIFNGCQTASQQALSAALVGWRECCRVG